MPSAICTLIKVDERTSIRKMRQYARLLVEVDMKNELTEKVMYKRTSIYSFASVMYERLPEFCRAYGIVGYAAMNYTSKKDRDFNARGRSASEEGVRDILNADSSPHEVDNTTLRYDNKNPFSWMLWLLDLPLCGPRRLLNVVDLPLCGPRRLLNVVVTNLSKNAQESFSVGAVREQNLVAKESWADMIEKVDARKPPKHDSKAKR
ncbi:hypothetical protein ACS0TY_033047 [Phlomoides rotata]